MGGRLRVESLAGFLWNMHTKLKAPKEETQLIANLLERYPVVQLSVNNGSNAIRACHYGQISGNITIESFISKDCAAFPARTIRASERIAVNLNVMLFREKSPDKNKVERTATLNLSRGGCFIISAEEFEQDETVWVGLRDLPGAPVEGTVRWLMPWGTSRNIPGIGIKFVGLDDARTEALMRLI